MNVDSKFSNNSEVWVIYNNKACKFPIIGTSAYLNKDNTTSVSYIVNVSTVDREIGECFNEDHCFATKEELINSL